MGEVTNIAWCDSTWSPFIGCTKVSAGCKFCYAERENNHRYWTNQWGPTGERKVTSLSYWRRRVFCGSLCDVFEDHRDLVEPRQRLWTLIANTPHLDWLLLTKRPENIGGMLPEGWGDTDGWPNVWMGVSVENQKAVQERVGVLLRVPAAVHFLSIEPMLAPVNIGTYLMPGISIGVDWVIVGCESGSRRRPMQLEWVRGVVCQCQMARVPIFIKQIEIGGKINHDPASWPVDLRLQEVPNASFATAAV